MLNADVEVDRRDLRLRAAIQVAPGERLALFGPSGAGKTTVLEAIAGLVTPRRGRITLGGRVLASTEPRQAVPAWERRVGLLRQDPGLFPHLSVRANLAYGRPVPEPELAGLAGLLGVGDLLPVMLARLSGGQAHRVALGRLLLAHCDALLLDEPYTGLDASLRRALTDLVVSLVVARDVPAVLVTHELADAQAFAGQARHPGPRPAAAGRRARRGGPAPVSRRVAELVGYLGFVPVTAGRLAGIHPERTLAGAHPGRGVVLTGAVAGCRPAGPDGRRTCAWPIR